MASKAVMDAVAARVAAGWSRTPVTIPNVDATVPSDASAFLTVEFPVANETQMSVGAPGANVFREEGAIRFSLSMPVGRGFNPWLGYMDELRSLFRDQTFAGVDTFETPPPSIDRSADGAYREMSFSVAYQYDIFA